MTYTLLVTVKVDAESEHEAYAFVKHALDQAKKQEVIYVDAEVIETEPENENDAEDDRDDDYERAALRAELTDFEDTDGRNWT